MAGREETERVIHCPWGFLRLKVTPFFWGGGGRDTGGSPENYFASQIGKSQAAPLGSETVLKIYNTPRVSFLQPHNVS